MLIFTQVNRLRIVFHDRVFSVTPNFTKKIVAGLNISELVERLARGRVRRAVKLLIDVNADSGHLRHGQ